MGKWEPAPGPGKFMEGETPVDTFDDAMQLLGLSAEELTDFAHTRFEFFRQQMLKDPDDYGDESKWKTLYMAGFIEGATWWKEQHEGDK